MNDYNTMNELIKYLYIFIIKKYIFCNFYKK